jgi:hypothetical protein
MKSHVNQGADHVLKPGVFFFAPPSILCYQTFGKKFQKRKEKLLDNFF